MENIEVPNSGHRKIIIIFLIGFALLVIGGVVWYTVNHNSIQNNSDIPLDTDGDLLSDADENKFGTDIRNPDTDGDGLSDSDEVRLSTDPKNAHSISPSSLDSEAAIDAQIKADQAKLDSRILKLKTQK